MQGFTVEPGKAAHYERTFSVPKDWDGKRIRLRCDAVFSDATVWINGREAGTHLGGFTPFELDVTALVKLGAENVITLAVISESVADTLASASQYASHKYAQKIPCIVCPSTRRNEEAMPKHRR